MKFKFGNSVGLSIFIVIVVAISIIIGILVVAKVGPFASSKPAPKASSSKSAPKATGTMARYIKITQPKAVYMTLGWLEAYSSNGSVNIALNKPVTTSWAQGGASTPVGNINNGVTTGYFHSNSNVAGNSFTIDLGDMTNVSSVKLYYTTSPTVSNPGCVSRMLGLVLTLLDESNTVVYTSSPTMDTAGKSTLPTAECGVSTAYKSYTFSPSNKTPVGK